MSRLNPEIPTGLPEEGLVKLKWRPPPDHCKELADEWIGDAHLLRREKPELLRSWSLVVPNLQRKLCGLAQGENPWPLYLWGPVGSGKTRAALAFCDQIVDSRFWTVSDLLNEIHAGLSPQRFGPVALAVLDELGIPRAGKGHDFEYQAVLDFFAWREGKPTIYITNHSPDQILGAYDLRLKSRLLSGTDHALRDRDRREPTP